MDLRKKNEITVFRVGWTFSKGRQHMADLDDSGIYQL